MADKIFEDDEFITKRFSCDCLSPHHILDVSIELTDKGKRFVLCSLDFYVAGKSPFKYRLRQIWNLLRGKEGELCDFLLRLEDVGELIELLERVKTGREK